MSLAISAVEKPGREQQLDCASHVEVGGRLLVDQARSSAPSARSPAGRSRDRRRGPRSRRCRPRGGRRSRACRLGASRPRAAPRGIRARDRASCARGARAGHRARRRQSGRARSPCRSSSSSTSLPSFVERSRTSRGKRRKTMSTGIIRTCMTICCESLRAAGQILHCLLESGYVEPGGQAPRRQCDGSPARPSSASARRAARRRRGPSARRGGCGALPRLGPRRDRLQSDGLGLGLLLATASTGVHARRSRHR